MNHHVKTKEKTGKVCDTTSAKFQGSEAQMDSNKDSTKDSGSDKQRTLFNSDEVHKVNRAKAMNWARTMNMN